MLPKVEAPQNTDCCWKTIFLYMCLMNCNWTHLIFLWTICIFLNPIWMNLLVLNLDGLFMWALKAWILIYELRLMDIYLSKLSRVFFFSFSFFFGCGSHFFWRWVKVFLDGSTSEVRFQKPDASWYFLWANRQELPTEMSFCRETDRNIEFSRVIFSVGALTEKYFLTAIRIFLTVFGLRVDPKSGGVIIVLLMEV